MIVATLTVKEMLLKDHVDVLRGSVSQASVNDTIRRSLRHFGSTHDPQDIEDLNLLLTWVMYGESNTSSLALLNAATALSSSKGGFINLREKIERDYSQYFVVVDLDGGEVRSSSDSTFTQLLNEGKTMVKLAHSSITRYSGRSEIVTIPGKDVAIGVRKENAVLAMTKTCLLALFDLEINHQENHLFTDIRPIVDYAVTHLDTHLKAITWFYDSLKLEHKIFLASHLTRLVKDEVLWRRYWFNDEAFHGRQ